MKHHDAWHMMPRNVTLCGRAYASGAGWTRAVTFSPKAVTCPACATLLDELLERQAVRLESGVYELESVSRVRAVLEARGITKKVGA